MFKDLDGDDVMILDGLNLIYVWVGNGANKEEKKEAENMAKVNFSKNVLKIKILEIFGN